MRANTLASVIAFLAPMMSAASAATPFELDSPLGIVTKLYHDYSYEAAFNQNAPYSTILDQPEPVLDAYFTPSLTRLILQDRKCAVAHGWGYCHIDFMPMWAGQDATGDLVGLSQTAKPNEILVTLTVPDSTPGTTEKVDLLYTVTKTRRGWRIADIRAKGWDLVSTLTSKIDH